MGAHDPRDAGGAMRNPERLCPDCHNSMIRAEVPVLDEQGYLCTQCGDYWVQVSLEDIKRFYGRRDEEE